MAAQRPTNVPPALAALTGRKAAFAREYLMDGNATAAYIRAGYAGKGARANATRLMKDPAIAAAIAAVEAQLAEVSIATIARLEVELERIALADVRKLVNPDCALKLPTEWDDDIAAAVASIDLKEEFDGAGKDRKQTGWVKKVRTWNKVQALVELLRRRDQAAKGPLGIKGNPMHHAISFIEIGSTDSAPRVAGPIATAVAHAVAEPVEKG
jgi:phage terminase small subunit